MTFFPILVVSLKDCFKEIPVDIYIQINENKYVKTFDRKTGIDFQRLANYKAKGIEYLYVDENDKAVLDKFLEVSPVHVLCSPRSTITEKRKAFVAALEQSVFEVFESVEFDQDSAQKAYVSIKRACEGDMNFATLFQPLAKLSSNKDVFYRHAISTCIFSYLLAINSGMNSQRSLGIILFSSVFHDVGRLRLPEAKRVRANNTSEADLENFLKHPEHSVEIFQDNIAGFSEEISRCIMEHKERVDGKGYPKKLTGPKIFVLAKILAIADTYSELLLGVEDGTKYSSEDALKIMKADQGRFDTKMLHIFINVMTRAQRVRAA